MSAPDTASLVAAILNDWWMVRHYVRGGRMTDQTCPLARKRLAAIRHLGLTIRRAFTQSDNFEPLIAAVVQGGSPKDDPPF